MKRLQAHQRHLTIEHNKLSREIKWRIRKGDMKDELLLKVNKIYCDCEDTLTLRQLNYWVGFETRKIKDNQN